jgi:Uncharacterized conserved protein (COG2071)
MRAELRVRDLLLVSWRVDAESVARTLPAGLESAAVDGEHLVSLAALRYAGGRLGRLPLPPFCQLNVRVYALWQEKPAVLFLDARVSPPGAPAQLVGVPVRTSVLRFGRGRADAPGLGVRVRYELDGEADPGELGRHEVGLFPSGRELRGIRMRRDTGLWQTARATEAVRADPVLALGFDVGEPPALLYCAGGSLAFEVPPKRLMTSTSSSGSSA